MDVGRISTLASAQSLLSGIQKLQKSFDASAQAIVSGKKVSSYSEVRDPFSTVSRETMAASLESYVSVSQRASLRLNLVDQALSGLESIARSMVSELSSPRNSNPASATDQDVSEINRLRELALKGLSSVQGYLNTDIEGSFLFSGSQTNKVTSSLPTKSLSDFSSVFDGGDVPFPDTPAGSLFSGKFSDLKLSVSGSSFSGVGYSRLEILPSPNGPLGFTTGSLSNNSVLYKESSLVSGGPGTFSGKPGQFSGLTEGSTLLLDGAEKGIFKVVSVSQTGSFVKVIPAPSSGTESSSGYSLKIGVPEGSVVSLENSSLVSGSVRVSYPSSSDLQASGDLDSVLSGKVLFVKPPSGSSGVESGVSVVGKGFYQGDSSVVYYRIPGGTVPVTQQGGSPVFERLVRALGILAQPVSGTSSDQVSQFEERSQKSLSLLNSVLRGDESLSVSKERLSFSQTTLKNTQEKSSSMLESIRSSLPDDLDTNMVLEIVNLMITQRALEASYNAFGRIQKMSLADYI